LLLRGVPLGLLLAFALHFGHVLLGGNFRTVLPGEVYRSSQPSPEQLEQFVQRYHIRTVVNLRGVCPDVDWYRDEALATARLDVSQEDVHLSATRMPSTLAVRRLVEVLQRSERPLLIHCQQGADRTGLASALVLLLRRGTSVAEARKQLSLAGGHLSMGRTAQVDRFLDLYESWLSGRGRRHCPETFRAWVESDYCPDGARARFSLVDPPGPVVRGIRPRGRLVKVRCDNVSQADWHFKTGLTAGMHLLWWVVDDNERVVAIGRSGLREATVRPGEHLDVGFVLPPLPPGRYRLHADLTVEQHATFAQLGNEVLCVEVVVSPPVARYFLPSPR
jgi:predicted protein tyrosine phosphatase